MPLRQQRLDGAAAANARPRSLELALVLPPMVKFAYTLIDHRELLLNWFQARKVFWQ